MMHPARIYKISGYLSILAGIAATLCIFRMQFLYYGMAVSILGFLLAGINLFFYSRYFHEQEKIPKGYLGMFLSSLPVLFLLVLVFKFRN